MIGCVGSAPKNVNRSKSLLTKEEKRMEDNVNHNVLDHCRMFVQNRKNDRQSRLGILELGECARLYARMPALYDNLRQRMCRSGRRSKTDYSVRYDGTTTKMQPLRCVKKSR